jgi:antitoxin component of RelBE/YafQ-DinJ toxin-antitoxin module
MNTPRRTIRIDDPLWNAAAAKADKEGTNMSKVIRRLLTAYVKAGAAIVLAVLALSACSAANEPASSPVAARTAQAPVSVPETPAMSDSDAQAIIDGSMWAEMAAGDPQANATMLRVVKGECFSISFGPTAEQWGERMADQPTTDDGVWKASMHEWASSLPVGCDDVDDYAISFYSD